VETTSTGALRAGAFHKPGGAMARLNVLKEMMKSYVVSIFKQDFYFFFIVHGLGAEMFNYDIYF
jgi:hypothetical protein